MVAANGIPIRVLVPLDGSLLAEQAIPYAAALAGPAEEIALLHVAPPLKRSRDVHGDVLPMTETALETYEEQLRDRLVCVAHRWHDVVPNVAIHVGYGDPAEEILRVSAQVRTGLIVLASHGRGALGRWRFGSVADRLTRSALVPVMVVRPRDALVEVGPAPLQRFVVPLDGSALAARALPVAECLARRTRLPVNLIRVLPAAVESWLPSFGAGAVSEGARDAALAAERGAAETLEAAEATLAAAGVPAASSLEAGDVVERITAAVRPDDVIVLASHGQSGLRRWALGSVAEKLIRHADAPVIVVRAGTTPAA